MKKRAYLHIGRHKTGTTPIQLQLAERQEELAAHGVLYPHTGREVGAQFTIEDRSAHHAIARALFLPREAAKAKLAAMRPSFVAETAGAETILLSSEGFQNILHTDLLAEFLEGFEIQPICYLREYLSYVVSSYAQEIKGSGLAVDLPFFERTFQMDLANFAERWENVGPCHWRLYERHRFPMGNIVNDFFDCLNLPLRAKEEKRDSNVSFAGSLLSYKLLLNILGIGKLNLGRPMLHLAASKPEYRGTVFVPAALQAQIRDGNEYNQVLDKMVGSPELSDFETGRTMFDPVFFPQDFAEIASAMPDVPELRQQGAYSLMKRVGVVRGQLYEHPLIKAIVETQSNYRSTSGPH